MTLTNYTGMITQLPCQQKRITSAIAGAAVAMYGYDQMFPLPRMAHYAVAGALVDFTCRGSDVRLGSTELMYSGAYGIAGAAALGLVMGRGLSLY